MVGTAHTPRPKQQEQIQKVSVFSFVIEVSKLMGNLLDLAL